MADIPAMEECPSGRGPVDEKPPLGQMLTLGLQHALAMYSGAVAVPLILGNALSLPEAQVAFLINADLLMCGCATLMQTLGVSSTIGIRMPVMMGATLIAVGPMISIGKSLGLPYVYGSIFAAALMMLCLAGTVSRLRRHFPPLVTGCIVTTIGISLIPVAAQWMGEGLDGTKGASGPGLALAFGVIAAITLVQRWGRGFVASISVLIGLVLGSLVAWFLGTMDLSSVSTSSWMSLPHPFWYGVPRFEAAAVLSMAIIALVCAIESTGVFHAVGQIVHAEIGEKEVAQGLRAEALSSLVASVFNAFPYITFSQNLGLLALTRVHSRFVVATAGLILVLMGIVPALGAVIAAIPKPVLGGASLVMFGMVAVAGIRLLATVDYEREENAFIVALSLGLGVGISAAPHLVDSLPATVRFLFSNGVIVGATVAVLLNAVMGTREDSHLAES